ncbi:MAG: SDR family oxidoreductase [Pseudomonadota bacterium]|nr:SDR family oxidoreductase [Pseudomonadota bacterium]
MAKTVLITGCSSGFGKLAAQLFAKHGWNVVATMRSPEKETDLQDSETMLVTRLDVTDPASIAQAVEQTMERFGAIDVLVNNAGFGSNSMFEQSDMESIRSLYETNVFGLMMVTQAVLPHMRKAGSGTVVNVTSMAGLMGLVGNSAYSSSKFAVEGLTEALAVEYTPLGIGFHTIAPGAYGTTAFNANVDVRIDQGDPQLQELSTRLRDHFAGLVTGSPPQDPQEVADVIYACATTDMPVHNVSGADAQMLTAKMGESSNREDFVNFMKGYLVPQS